MSRPSSPVPTFSVPVSSPMPLPPTVTGRLIVVTGPSGVGKGTLLNLLRQAHPELQVSVSATTRAPRTGEQHGQHYYFLEPEEFLALRETDQLLEWAEYAGNFYGTPLAPVQKQLAAGSDVLLEIEVAGARQVAKVWPQALRIFICPPSLDELERRLRQRAQDSEQSIQQRLAQAKSEMAAAPEFSAVLINENLNQTLTELEAILYGSLQEHHEK